MPKRKSCRKFYQKLRDDMSQEEVSLKSEMICKQVLESVEYKMAKTIFGYYPLGNEVNCLPILEQALNDGKMVVMPRTARDCQMDFYEIKSFDDVEEGHFHVMEPKAYCKRLVMDEQSRSADVLKQEKWKNPNLLALVPGVVFDYMGNRYGYGKGYYDRYFERFFQLNRMALGYAKQVVDASLECLETDVKMHIIITENEVLRIEHEK